MIFFTSDIHFGHKSVIEYANRPFGNIDQMNTEMIRRWNMFITDSDEVYYLGDLSFLNPAKTCEILDQLRGKKYWIAGNHDKTLIKKEQVCKYFEWVKDLYTLKVPDSDAPDGYQRIVLCHYTLKTWDRAHYGVWHLFGHSHGTMPDDPYSKSWDVGVDNNALMPIGYYGIKEIMKHKTFKPVDAHGRRNEI